MTKNAFYLLQNIRKVAALRKIAAEPVTPTDEEMAWANQNYQEYGFPSAQAAAEHAARVHAQQRVEQAYNDIHPRHTPTALDAEIYKRYGNRGFTLNDVGQVYRSGNTNLARRMEMELAQRSGDNEAAIGNALDRVTAPANNFVNAAGKTMEKMYNSPVAGFIGNTASMAGVGRGLADKVQPGVALGTNNASAWLSNLPTTPSTSSTLYGPSSAGKGYMQSNQPGGNLLAQIRDRISNPRATTLNGAAFGAGLGLGADLRTRLMRSFGR